MKLKRFVAKDMKAALLLVKEELGADAIIMSNKRIASGVEIVAGIENMPQPAAPVPAPSQSHVRVPVKEPAAASRGAAPAPERSRRLIGGKNQAYAKSLIEILERQQAMSKEQGDRLIRNIDAGSAQKSADPASAQPQTRSGAMQRPNGALQSAASGVFTPVNPTSAQSARPAAPDAQKTQIQSRTQPQSFRVVSEANFKSAEMFDSAVEQQNEAADSMAPVYGDIEDMANDPAKKAGPSTIDPSLDEDADLFKTAPLPISQQREFKNFFVKSKARQEKEDYESREGIDTYRAAPDHVVRQDLERMRSEVENIRKLLQFELAGLMQDNKSRTEPVKAMISKLLLSVGFSENVADDLVKTLPPEAAFNNSWRHIISRLESAIVTGDDEIVSKGGIVTLIGPAGVGKTTTLAKLAARFVMRYGPQRIAIVTADHYRIGAVEQIKTYGRIMGCSTFAVKSLSELPQLLYSMSDKSLVLVDTAGVGFKDERFSAQLSQLKLQSSLKLKHYLVLPCTAQRKVLQHAYDHFSIVGLTGLILTKLDECQSLGDALSLCIDMNLPLSYITDGQRVPEDIDVPHPNDLARRALSGIEDDMAQKAIKE